MRSLPAGGAGSKRPAGVSWAAQLASPFKTPRRQVDGRALAPSDAPRPRVEQQVSQPALKSPRLHVTQLSQQPSRPQVDGKALAPSEASRLRAEQQVSQPALKSPRLHVDTPRRDHAIAQTRTPRQAKSTLAPTPAFCRSGDPEGAGRARGGGEHPRAARAVPGSHSGRPQGLQGENAPPTSMAEGVAIDPASYPGSGPRRGLLTKLLAPAAMPSLDAHPLAQGTWQEGHQRDVPSQAIRRPTGDAAIRTCPGDGPEPRGLARLAATETPYPAKRKRAEEIAAPRAAMDGGGTRDRSGNRTPLEARKVPRHGSPSGPRPQGWTKSKESPAASRTPPAVSMASPLPTSQFAPKIRFTGSSKESPTARPAPLTTWAATAFPASEPVPRGLRDTARVSRWGAAHETSAGVLTLPRMTEDQIQAATRRLPQFLELRANPVPQMTAEDLHDLRGTPPAVQAVKAVLAQGGRWDAAWLALMEISTSCKADAYASEWNLKGYSDVCALIGKPALPVSLLNLGSWWISRLERQQGRKLKSSALRTVTSRVLTRARLMGFPVTEADRVEIGKKLTEVRALYPCEVSSAAPPLGDAGDGRLSRVLAYAASRAERSLFYRGMHTLLLVAQALYCRPTALLEGHLRLRHIQAMPVTDAFPGGLSIRLQLPKQGKLQSDGRKENFPITTGKATRALISWLADLGLLAPGSSPNAVVFPDLCPVRDIVRKPIMTVDRARDLLRRYVYIPSGVPAGPRRTLRSIRSGASTDAAARGVPFPEVVKQGGWGKSGRVARVYVDKTVVQLAGS